MNEVISEDWPSGFTEAYPFLAVPAPSEGRAMLLALCPPPFSKCQMNVIQHIHISGVEKVNRCNIVVFVLLFGDWLLCGCTVKTRAVQENTGRQGLKITFGFCFSATTIINLSSTLTTAFDIWSSTFRESFESESILDGCSRLAEQSQLENLSQLFSPESEVEHLLLTRTEHAFAVTPIVSENLLSRVIFNSRLRRAVGFGLVKPLDTVTNTLPREFFTQAEIYLDERLRLRERPSAWKRC